MSSCCSTSCDTKQVKKHACPRSGQLCITVSETTITHHLKKPWQWKSKQQSYYFCDDPNCDVAYFSLDNHVIEKSELRTVIGIKEQQAESLLCYCYGVSYHDAKTHPDIKTYVMKKTKEKQCACETRNPSGRCCLKDFPK